MASTLSAARLSSSLRSRSAEESLRVVIPLAMSRGISRVVDTTWLDKIGIPVFASIRPDAEHGTLCVHAGKGFTIAEAKIGAYMEAIEYSFAAPGRSAVEWSHATPDEVLSSFKHEIAFQDFCPRLSSNIFDDERIPVVRAEEILQGLGSVILPAELVYHPFPVAEQAEIFGTSTNGLASGNTLLEATTHGLAEVLERDVISFDHIDNQSYFIELNTASPKIQKMAKMIEDAGLICALRYSENPYGLACFSAYVLEPDEESAIAVATGHGLHPIREIAAVRALAEAVQSRLSHIHGGRDDIIKRFHLAKNMGRQRELDSLRNLRNVVMGKGRLTYYQAVPDYESSISTMEDAFNCLTEALKRGGLKHIARVVFTPVDYPFQIARIVVPGAEMYERQLQRVGPRLVTHRKLMKK